MNNDLKIEISKHFSQTTEVIYTAWTEAEQLKAWWKPMNNILTEVSNDIKPGGAVKYIFESGLIISGNYDEVLQNEKLVYSWNWDFPKDEIKNASYKLNVTFKAFLGNSDTILNIKFITEDMGSTLHVIQTNFENEESIQPHKEGWEKGLNDLAAYLSSNNVSNLT